MQIPLTSVIYMRIATLKDCRGHVVYPKFVHALSEAAGSWTWVAVIAAINPSHSVHMQVNPGHCQIKVLGLLQIL